MGRFADARKKRKGADKADEQQRPAEESAAPKATAKAKKPAASPKPTAQKQKRAQGDENERENALLDEAVSEFQAFTDEDDKLPTQEPIEASPAVSEITADDIVRAKSEKPAPKKKAAKPSKPLAEHELPQPGTPVMGDTQQHTSDLVGEVLGKYGLEEQKIPRRNDPPLFDKKIELPSSGTAEEILARYGLATTDSGTTAPAAPRVESEPAEVRIGDDFELPSSGTAEEILAKYGLSVSAPTPSKSSPKKTERKATPQAAENSDDDSLTSFEQFLDAIERNENSNDAEKQRMRRADQDRIVLVTFVLDGEEYGLQVERIREINRLATVTRVPNVGAHVLGVMNLRGEIITVVDLKFLLKRQHVKAAKDTRVVIAEFGPKVLGLLVDAVREVMTIPRSVIEEAETEGDIESEYISRIAKLDNRLVTILDLSPLWSAGAAE